jgi:biopolymer transport protein ExbB
MRHALVPFLVLAAVVGIAPSLPAAGGGKGKAGDWWNSEWTVRKTVVLTPLPDAAPSGPVPVLLRLHSGNFQFGQAKEDGSDVRVIAPDGTTELPLHFERYDALMNEAFLWVLVPELAAGEPTTLHLYYGNQASPAPSTGAKETFPEPFGVVYHFTDRGSPAKDATGNADSPTACAGTDGALIAGGIQQFGTNGIEVPAAAWTAAADVTVSVWFKPSGHAPNAVLFTRTEGPSAYTLGLDNGVPFVEIKDSAGTARTSPGEAVAVGSWHHLAAVSSGTKTDLYVGGALFASVPKPIPALAAPGRIGGTVEAGGGVTGEVDEFRLHASALPAGALKFHAVAESGSEQATQMVLVNEDEGSGGHAGHPEWMEHIALFGDIANNMMFDGWIAVGICVVMIILCWIVAFLKFSYLGSIQKGTDLFLKAWRKLSADLNKLDLLDADAVRTMGGHAKGANLKHISKAPLYHLYQIGIEEISHRVNGQGRAILSARSLQAIRAALDSGLVHENHKMNSGLILLTISVAGGPYIGLLGTVVGVMITFAIIAKSGEVEVASIAPGIASALLATTVGLLVAIPALFIYSYLSSRIKLLLSSMQVFIDEFVTKMAEVYPEDEAGHGLPTSPAGPAPSARTESARPLPGAPSRPMPVPVAGGGMPPGTAPAAPADPLA